MFSPAPTRRVDFDRIIRASQRRFRTMLVDDYRPIADRLIAANRNVQTALAQMLLDFDARAATRGMTARELAQDRATVRLLNATQDELREYTNIIRAQATRAELSGITGGIAEGKAALELLNMGTVASITPETAGRLINYADSPAFDAVLRHYAGYHADYVRDMMVNLAARGVHPETVARWVTRYVENVPMYDAVRMTRTLQVYAARGGSRELYRANGITEWVWSSARDGRTCPACWAMHGTRHSVDETLNDHHMGRCLAPGTLVSAPSIVAFESRRYKGEMFGIRTSSGKFLAVTPNHPVLTDRGWCAAQFIQEGDHVVSGAFGDGTSFGMRPDEYHVPTMVEEIPRAFSMYRLGSVPQTAEDFHGDGTDGEVYVVWTNRQLGDDFDAMALKHLLEQHLDRGLMSETLLPSPGNEIFGPFATGSARLGELRGADDASPFVGGEFGHLDAIRFADGAQRYSLESKHALDGAPVEAICLVQFIDGAPFEVFTGDSRGVVPRVALRAPGTLSLFGSDLTGITGRALHPFSLQRIREALIADMERCGASFDTVALDISLDRVVEVSVTSFDGHVYNLQTEEQWYIANNIITHNCAPVPVTPTWASLGFEGGREVEVTDGETLFRQQPEATQRRVLGPARYAAWRDGVFQLRDVVGEYQDDVYGPMRRARSLKELTGETVATAYRRTA